MKCYILLRVTVNVKDHFTNTDKHVMNVLPWYPRKPTIVWYGDNNSIAAINMKKHNLLGLGGMNGNTTNLDLVE